MNAPPLHPRCRCTICAALGESLPVKRRNRVAEGRTKIGDVSYSEWKRQYVLSGEVPFKKTETKHSVDEDLKADKQRQDKIKEALQTVMNESGIKGKLEYPPPKMDFSEFKFDAEHTKGDRHPHNVNEEEARRFIRDAYFLLVKYNGNSYNYYGAEGAAFVRIDLKMIRTAFKADEYDDKIKKLIEVCENGR